MLGGKEGKGCTFFSFSRIIWSFWCSIFFKVATSSFSWAMMTKWSVPGESSARSGEKLQERSGKEPRHNPHHFIEAGKLPPAALEGKREPFHDTHCPLQTLPECVTCSPARMLHGMWEATGITCEVSSCIIADQTVKILCQTKELRTATRELMKPDATTSELCSLDTEQNFSLNGNKRSGKEGT